jgi:tRNA (guanine-N7-)-methyltransferase
MREGAFLDFKTDSADYFDWAIERFHASPFKVVRETRDLHSSEWKGENFITHFESLFIGQGLPIHYARLVKG